VRVTTAYNRMLGLAGAWVRDVEFSERAMIVTVALRRKRPLCSGCGARGLKIKDHRVKRWRHLDVGGVRNGRLEALNSKVRLLSHRAYGFHSAAALTAMIYLCCAGIQIALPHR
jgi:transposase